MPDLSLHYPYQYTADSITQNILHVKRCPKQNAQEPIVRHTKQLHQIEILQNLHGRGKEKNIERQEAHRIWYPDPDKRIDYNHHQHIANIWPYDPVMDKQCDQNLHCQYNDCQYDVYDPLFHIAPLSETAGIAAKTNKY